VSPLWRRDANYHLDHRRPDRARSIPRPGRHRTTRSISASPV